VSQAASLIRARRHELVDRGIDRGIFPADTFELLAFAKISRRRLDELIEKRCNHYRQMMGCMLSAARRVRPVIVGCSTAPPAQALAINDTDGCSLADGSGSSRENRACVYRKLKRAQGI